MSKAFLNAIDIIKHEIGKSGVNFSGQVPPLITVQLATSWDEGRFYDFLRHELDGSYVFDNGRMGSSLRANTQLTVSGVGVRITSDQRIDDIIRRNFK